MSFEFWVRFLIILLALVVLLMLVMKYQKKESCKKKAHSKRAKTVSKQSGDDEDDEADDVVEEESYSGKHRAQRKEHFVNDENYAKVPEQKSKEPVSCSQLPFQYEKSAADSVQPTETLDNEEFKAIDFDPSPRTFAPDCYPKERVTAEELLPKDAANSKWAQVNPAGQGELMNQNFLQPEARFGVDTVGQSLRNANKQLRSDPPITKLEGISPWMNSTIEYDSNRRFFEIGSI